MRYDLEERTSILGKNLIVFAKKISDSPVNRPIVSQLIRSGTSIGANYREADSAESKKDFNHKIGICKKEANETKYWLHMLATAVPEYKDETRKLWQEVKELHLIFNAIIRSSNKLPNP